MSKLLFFIFLVLMLLAGNHTHGQAVTGEFAIPTATPAPIQAVVIEDVIISNPPPAKNARVLCQDAEVRGAPYQNIEIEYIALAGTEVHIWETYYENFTSWWALIEYNPPLWVNMSALCKR